MCSDSIKIKDFDTLYAEICDKLRARSGDSARALDQISQSNSDYNRIKCVLHSNPNVLTLFSSHITDNFSAKNEPKAVELLKEACSQNSLPLINQALQLCHWELETHKKKEDQLLSPSNIRDHTNLQKFIGLAQKPETNTEPESGDGIISEIFSRRSAILFQFGKFESCIRDTFRSAHYGGWRTKTYEVVLRLGLSYKHLGFLPEAKLVAQHALDVLKLSRVDNEAKCKETLRLVAIIKDIQQQTLLAVPSSSGSVSSSSGKHGEKERGDKEKGSGASKCQGQGLDSLKYDLFEGQDNVLGGTSSALELRFSKERGRHVIARRDIPPGSTLIIEHPFAWSVTPCKYPSVCQNCLASEPSSSDGIPCPHCSTVIFCNEECRDKALKSFHKYECKILKLLDSSEKLGKMALLCFRTIVRVPLEEILATHQNFLVDVKKETSSTSAPNILLGFNSHGRLDSSNYASVFAQTTNSSSRNGGDLLKRTYASIYLLLCLRFVGYYDKSSNGQSNKEGSDLSERELILGSIILRHLQSVSCNAYGINHVASPATPSFRDKTSSRSKELLIEEMGGATFPMISTTNHSCYPNIYRFNVGAVCVVNSLLEIRAGEEIFDSYGPLFTTTPLKDRQSELENQYCFQCRCVACVNNWPSFHQLSSSSPMAVRGSPAAYRCPNCEHGQVPLDAGKDKRKCPNCGKLLDFKKLQKLVKAAEDKYKRAKECVLKQKLESPSSLEKALCDYILTVQRVRVQPSKELLEAQELLKLFWNLVVSNNQFLRVSKSVDK